MVRFLQINLNRFEAAQQLLSQLALDLSADILLVSDQLCNSNDGLQWVSSTDKICTVLSVGNLLPDFNEKENQSVNARGSLLSNLAASLNYLELHKI